MTPGTREFFSAAEQEEIRNAIMQAEAKTSGEIRVHIEQSHSGDVMDRAAYIFRALNMHKTKGRNGVLIYLALKNHSFAIIGDTAIHQKVGDHFWDDTKKAMLSHFREGHFTAGLTKAILSVGDQLKQHFPHEKDDVNELSDEISFGS